MRLVSTLALAATLLVCAATSAFAQTGSVSLTWDECAGDGGGLLKTFACNTNAGQDVLVCSFIAPQGVNALTGVEASIQIILCGQASWWELRNAGACRGTAMSLLLTPSDNATACADPWQGQALGGTSYSLQYNGNYDYSIGQLNVVVGIPAAAAIALTEGSEYHAFRLAFNHQKAVGTTTCTGCANTAALYPYQFRLTQLQAQDTIPITAVPNGAAAWQSPGATACIPDPVQNKTWGAVKSLYR